MSVKHLCSITLLALIIFVTPCQGQRRKNKKKKAATEKSISKEKTIKELTKNCVLSEGLFGLYRDTINGDLFFEIKKEQLNQEFIYFSYVEDGIVDAGHFKGNYRGSKIFTIEKYYDKIEFVQKNTGYYFDPENAISKSKDANINNPILANEKILASDSKKNTYLIKADDVFINESFQQIKPTPRGTNPSAFGLGSLSKTKSKILQTKNYPENTDIRVQYVYDNPYPKSYGSSAVTDARSISLEIQHSLIAFPKNNFKARKDDPRIGYFMTQVNDMTSTDVTPYRDIIHRWHLEKKDSSAAVSEVKEPITWWIENTTPLEFRDIIKNGVLQWNLAFEKAGFKNAVAVKIQPDTADWDAGDIRYNVLRWTSSPRPPFGGYGPSFVNPRTGQIIGADIMLELSSITNRLKRIDAYETASLNIFEESPEFDHTNCQMGLLMNHNTNLANNLMPIIGYNEMEKNEFVQQTLYRLVLHEVGHTLGLNHNMKASTMQSPADIKNKEKIMKEGLCNSVMEYPSINIAANKDEQTLFYDNKPGPYDYWAIDYGYSTSPANEEDEGNRLLTILRKSTEPNLMFGNDADDMRSAGKGIDPRVNIYDLSSDPVAYAIERMELIKTTLPKIKEKYSVDGQSNQEMLAAYMNLTGEYAIQLRVITRQIAGVHVDRSNYGQNTTKKPFEPLSLKQQKTAMNALSKYAFASNNFNDNKDLYPYLQQQRRGFNHFSSNEDPKIHGRWLSIHNDLLNHLLHRNVLRRIVDTKEYGNEYSLSNYMSDLTNALFATDAKGSVHSIRQNVQQQYVTRLLSIVNGKSYHYHAQAQALTELKSITRKYANKTVGDKSTQAHRTYLHWYINETLKK
jgi:predicted Zn-dependent protease